MAICSTSSNYIGRNVVAEFVESCGDVDPTGLTYLPFGSVNQKDVTVGTTTTDNTSDDTSGVQSALVTYLTFNATISGFATSADGTASNQALLKKYLVNEPMAGRQPTVFLRIIFPDVTYYAFCIVSENGSSAASGEVTGATFSFVSTATPVGSGINAVSIIDTPTV